MSDFLIMLGFNRIVECWEDGGASFELTCWGWRSVAAVGQLRAGYCTQYGVGVGEHWLWLATVERR